MRVRTFLLSLVLLATVDAAPLLPHNSVAAPVQDDPVIIVHDQPELALEVETESFADGIRAALVNRRYDDLEAMAAKFRDPEQRFQGGTSKITNFYKILGSFKTIETRIRCSRAVDDTSFDPRRDRLEAWRTATPGQPTAAIALAQLWTEAALVERGCDSADRTTDKQWAGMKADLEKAVQALAGIDLDADPFAYDVALTLARYGSAGRPEIDALYARAIKRFPNYYPLYSDRARVLQEKWDGRPGELATFLRQLQAPQRGADGQIAYAFAAFVLLSDYSRGDNRDTDGLTLPGIVAAYQAREKRFGLRDHDWKVLFCFALHASKWQLGHEAVQHMSRDWDTTVWTKREYFESDIALYLQSTPFKEDIARLKG